LWTRTLSSAVPKRRDIKRYGGMEVTFHTFWNVKEQESSAHGRNKKWI
jgi:hypothetical protein